MKVANAICTFLGLATLSCVVYNLHNVRFDHEQMIL